MTEPKRAYRCKACRKADLHIYWPCRKCGRKVCFHGGRFHRVNGTCTCRPCAWAEVRAFNQRYGRTDSTEPEPVQPEEEP